MIRHSRDMIFYHRERFIRKRKKCFLYYPEIPDNKLSKHHFSHHHHCWMCSDDWNNPIRKAPTVNQQLNDWGIII